MDINFDLILVIIVFATGVFCVLEKFWLSRNRPPNVKKPLIIEYSLSLFPILLIVLAVRSFIFEPFHIPSGSLEPTLLQGDFILVNKFSYGLRLPVLDSKFTNVNEPKVGDIIVFHYPPNPSIDYIKRVVGVPGNKISYINKVLYINGQPQKQTLLGYTMDNDGTGDAWVVAKVRENLNGIEHDIYINPHIPAGNFFNIVVPSHMYFVMGDNRDDSQDSRYWGFVPEQNLVGHAFLVWFSWNNVRTDIRWSRIGTRIH